MQTQGPADEPVPEKDAEGAAGAIVEGVGAGVDEAADDGVVTCSAPLGAVGRAGAGAWAGAPW